MSSYKVLTTNKSRNDHLKEDHIQLSLLQTERNKLQRDLENAKKDLGVVVQEMVFTEEQLSKRDKELVELKIRLEDYRQECNRTSTLAHSYQQSQKSIEQKEYALQTYVAKEQKYLQAMADQQKKLQYLQEQVNTFKQTQSANQHIHDQLQQQANSTEKLNQQLRKEIADLKQCVNDMTSQQEALQKRTKELTEERTALQDQIKHLLTSDLSKEEKSMLYQSAAPTIHSDHPTTSLTDRLNISLHVSNTLKLLSSSKERIKDLENQNAKLRAAVVDIATQADKEKSVLLKQIGDLQKTIRQQHNDIQQSSSLEAMQSLKHENKLLRDKITELVEVTNNPPQAQYTAVIQTEREALLQEANKLDQIISSPRTNHMRSDYNHDYRAQSQYLQHAALEQERALRRNAEMGFHTATEEVQALVDRVNQLEYCLVMLNAEKSELEGRLTLSSLDNRSFYDMSVPESPSTKGILKKSTDSYPNSPKYSDSLTNLNSMLRKVRAK